MKVEPKKNGVYPRFFLLCRYCVIIIRYSALPFSHLALFSVIPASEPVSLPLSCYSGATKMPD